MIRFIKSLYFTDRFFIVLSVFILSFVVGYFVELIYIITKYTLVLFGTLLIFDLLVLYIPKQAISGKRKMKERLSNGDQNTIFIELENRYGFPVYCNIIDEIPHQFQVRDFSIKSQISSGETKTFKYEIRPTARGVYLFGRLNLYISTLLHLIQRKFYFEQGRSVPVYPSYIQMHKYELMAISNRMTEVGVKKIRKISNNNEFDQIRDYISGDDFRTINWKATARRNHLMVNQYQDEKSQQVYSLIDMGRTMKMPFDQLSLLDYAINSTLVISNIAMFKQDRAGILTFADKIHHFLPANRKKNQMQTIMELLYKQRTQFLEANHESVYALVSKKIRQRSLLLLYTNFEGMSSMKRQLNFFRMLNKNHLLVVIFFENTEVKEMTQEKATNLEETYIKTIAEKFSYEKKLIVKELKAYGIHAIYTEPKNLTVNTINKYLELKAVGLI